jgi:NADPH-dependent glutamate synthase beta subunit-like oxidoreductase
VAVIGGGAAAVDCAITAVKQGAVHTEMFVRRSLSDMRITAHERDLLLANRVDISTMTRITRIESEAAGVTVYTCKTRFNAAGKLEDVPQSEIARGGFAYIISALGSTRAAEPVAGENIFYVGDFINGGSTAVEAVASGKKAALEIANRK